MGVLFKQDDKEDADLWQTNKGEGAAAVLCVQCHTFTGTVTYMSPERINSEPYSFPADIWWAFFLH